MPLVTGKKANLAYAEAFIVVKIGYEDILILPQFLHSSYTSFVNKA